MYPRLSDLFQDLFGFSFPIPIYSFGAFVAIGVLTAAWLTGKELDRLYRAGRIEGVVLAVEGEKRGKKRRTHRQTLSPSALIGTVTIIAVVAGFAGAKLFHILENLDDFSRDPGGLIFSRGGFTYYGGLIVAALAIAYYVRKKGVTVGRFADAIAPGLIIGYGIGRIGCHLAGDGDWGVVAPLADKPGWLPTWLWAETYPNNILGVDLAAPVFPTPLYEFGICLLFFGVLWALRKHPFVAGWLFWLYVTLNGLERLLIEQIRVNNEFDVLGLTVTQAEIIASSLILVGLIGLARTSRKADASDASSAQVTPA